MVGSSSPWGGSKSSRPDGWRLTALVFGHLSTLDRLTCLFFCTVITVLAILHRCLKREGLCNWEQLEKDIGRHISVLVMKQVLEEVVELKVS